MTSPTPPLTVVNVQPPAQPVAGSSSAFRDDPIRTMANISPYRRPGGVAGWVRYVWDRWDVGGHRLLGAVSWPEFFQLGAAGLGVPWLIGGVGGFFLLPRLVWLVGGLAATITLVVFSVRLVAWWRQFYRGPAQLRAAILGRDSTARSREIESSLSTTALMRSAPHIRPGHPAPLPSDVGWLIGTARTWPVWMPGEHGCIVVGPPRSGKGTGVIINAIMGAPGAVITTSTRVDNMVATAGGRAKVGPIGLFDLEGVSGRAHTIAWSPIWGCENPLVAQRRAMTLVGTTGISDGQNAIWGSSAGGVIQALLHAAAISGSTIHDLWRWSKSPQNALQAVEILQTQASVDAQTWEQAITTIKNEDPRLGGSKWFAVVEAFRVLDVASVRDRLDPKGAQPIDLGKFLLSSGTIYVLAKWRATAAGTSANTGAFVALFLDDVTDTAHKIAEYVTGRLEPPVTLVLDEILNIHPWARLPQILNAGGGDGICTISAWQSRTQGRDAYGDGEATMWNAAYKLVLGGGTDDEAFAAMSRLVGQDATRRTSTQTSGLFATPTVSENTDLVPGLSFDDLRRIGEGQGLLIAGRTRPVLVDLAPYWLRPWAGEIAASKAWHQDNPASLIPGQPAPIHPGRTL